jgi:glycosyltransferase involved in cell wall biosynthesis
VFGLCLAISAGLVYLFNAAMGRLFTARDFGTFGALLALMLALSGPTTALYGGAAMSTARTGRIPRTPWRIGLLMVGLAAALVGLLPLPGTVRATGWFGVACVMWVLLSWARGLLIGLGRLGLVGATSVFDGLARLGLAVLLIARGWGIGGGAAGLALGLTATLLLTQALLPRERDDAADTVGRNVWIAVVGLLFVTITQFADVVAVRLIDPAHAGQYTAAASLARIALYTSGPAAAYALRRTAVVGARGALPRSVVLAAVPGAVACAILLFAPQFLLSVTYGGRYTQAAALVRILVVAMALAGAALVAISALIGAGRTGWTIPLTLVSAVGLICLFAAAESVWRVAFTMVVVEAVTLAVGVLFLCRLLAAERKGDGAVVFLNWRDTRHPQGGGSEVFVEEIARRLAATGRRVTIFCAAHDDAPRSEVVDDVRFIRRGSWRSVYAWGALYHLTGRFGPHDVVVDVQNAIPFFSPLYCCRRVVALVHHVHREQWRMMFSRRTSRAGWWIESALSPRVYCGAQYVTVSEASMRDLSALGVAPDRIEVVRNGTTMVAARPRASGRARTPDPTIVYLGRLVPHKRIELLFDATAALLPDIPSLRLRVVGRGPWEDRLRDEVDRLGLSSAVRFDGFLADREKLEALASAWVMGMPSVKEGWGLSVVEAAAAGTPSVAFRVSGLCESIVDGETGLLSATFDDFVANLRAVLTSEELRDRLGNQAHRHAGLFTWDETAEAMTAILDRAPADASAGATWVTRTPATLAPSERPAVTG